MLAARTRSGLVETEHQGVVSAFDSSGQLIAWSGDLDRPFYLRSSAKPFQAFVTLEAGARLNPLQTALAAASHDGFPAHLSIVKSILEDGGLTEDHLRCPPGWPLGSGARDRLNREGHTGPRRLWHNCSGKHAGWLRACQAQGWPLDDYLSPEHPLQRRIVEFVTEIGGTPAAPVGVDGCGAPVLRTTARAMGIMFSRLATEERFRDVFDAMHTYPALVSGVGNGDTSIAIATNSAAKRGAAGCIGVGVRGQWGVAVKAWDGNDTVAALAAASVLTALGAVPDAGLAQLSETSSPAVLGGGKPVGSLEPRLELTWS